MKENEDTVKEIAIPEGKLEYLQKELTNIRDELRENTYIQEAIRALSAGCLRSTIGAYWNAVIDDLRKKIIHRSLDLFNKEVKASHSVNKYEDFQDHVTDYQLIDGSYRIGVISWEGRKLLHQARETRHIFDGHPDSSEPNLFKVFNMMADCNRYMLSQDYPVPIIEVDKYINVMASENYDKNEIAVEQALSDLPEVYKIEMANKLFTDYSDDKTSTTLRSNIEFSFPILWKVLPKGVREQLGKRFDKLVVEGDSKKINITLELLTFVDGLRYVSNTSRKIIYEPLIKELEDNLDKWSVEGKVISLLHKLGSVIPDTLIERFVCSITLTYVGYRGSSLQFSRTDFYSNSAAPKVSQMFEKFDNRSVESFIDVIKTNDILKKRITYSGQLNRLRSLANILLNKPEVKNDSKVFLELLVNEEKTNDFFYSIGK